MQQVPDGVSAGFASAGALWKERAREGEAAPNDGKKVVGAKGEGRKVDDEVNVDKNREGKLVRPKKKAKGVRDEGASWSAALKEGALDENTIGQMSQDGKKPFPNVYNIPMAPPITKPSPTREQSVSLSEYAFDPPEVQPNLQLQQEPPKPTKKPRKKAMKDTAKVGNTTTKKSAPRKRKVKSEATVVNSDEPTPQEDAEQHVQAVMHSEVSGPEPTNTTERGKPKRSKKEKGKAMQLELDQPVQQASSSSFESAKTADVERLAEYSMDFANSAPGLHEPSPVNRRNESTAPIREVVTTHASPSLHRFPPADALASEKSGYFHQPSIHDSDEVTTQAANVHPIIETEDAPSAPPMEKPTYRRRRSWTPSKDTEVVDFRSRPPTADSNRLDASQAPALNLTSILGSFNYVCTESAPTDRTSNGEAATKRRRIDLAADTVVGVATRKETETPAQPKQKKTKALKKKAQTITALATAAFQPPKETEAAQETVSEFFVPRKPEETAPAPLEQHPAPTKPKRQRKSRAKTATNENQAEAHVKQKKPSKPKKPKLKPKTPKLLPILHSPSRASAQLKNQAFLFGTSSQLAADESPTFIRDMQAAIRESEFGPQPSTAGEKFEDGSQELFSSQVRVSRGQGKWGQGRVEGKSYAKVPTAPHGTCLSVGQGGREMWCGAARDFQGGVVRREEAGGGGDVQEESGAAVIERLGTGGVVEVKEAEGQVEELRCLTEADQALPPAPSPQDRSKSDGAALVKADEITCEMPWQQGALKEQSVVDRRSQEPVEEDDDSWMLLLSSDPAPQPPQRAESARMPPLHFDDTAPTSIASPVEQSPSPPPFRPALQPLDANMSVLVNSSPQKSLVSAPQVRSLTTDEPPKKAPPASRPRGRPRKDANSSTAPTSVTTQSTSPKKRGCLPKRSAGDVLASDSSPRRKKPKTMAPPASQPAPQTEEWLHIDEISDPEPVATPSPPRRRGSEEAAMVLPLNLGPSPDVAAAAASPSAKEKVKHTAESSTAPPPARLKPSDDTGQWQSIRTVLFPRITAAVKSASEPATLHGKERLSWYEKMLLYDPIVVEDLTAWLNEQGLCVEVRRRKTKLQKQKEAKKSRRKKKKEDEPAGEELAEEAEVEETVEEPLQPWMVQKWCEEKSVCCYTRESSWRGQRGRY